MVSGWCPLSEIRWTNTVIQTWATGPHDIFLQRKSVGAQPTGGAHS